MTSKRSLQDGSSRLAVVERSKAERNRAPGALELARSLMNTWQISNETRVPEDRLAAVLLDDAAWDDAFPSVERGAHDTLEQLAELRSTLRGSLGEGDAVEQLNRWLAISPVGSRLVLDGSELRLQHVPQPGTGLVGALMTGVVEAVELGSWARLKVCPDCRTVFFDQTRNASKVWCGMMAGGPGGRACGTIAKVRRWRERQASVAQGELPRSA
jgi:predicted RNA-binding Zn ribbon-like protein